MKKRRLNLQKNISGWTLLLPSVILFIFLIWRPIIIGIAFSFFKLSGFTPTEFVGLKNYMDVITDTDFLQTIGNTVQYVIWSFVIGFPLPIIVAAMINEMIHFRGFFKVSTYLPVVVPAIASCLIWKMMYMNGEGGLLNVIMYNLGLPTVDWLTNKALVIPLIVVTMTWSGFGGTTLIYLATLQSINQELYEAARIDGAGFFRRIWHVMLPHLKGMILLGIIMQIISVFKVTEQPLVMTGGGPNGASLSIGLTNYFYAFKYGQYDKSLALGVITFLILISFTFAYNGLQKKLEN